MPDRELEYSQHPIAIRQIWVFSSPLAEKSLKVNESTFIFCSSLFFSFVVLVL